MIGVFDNGTGVPTLFGRHRPHRRQQHPISRVVVFDGRLLVIKDSEGVFLLDEQRRTMEQDLFTELRGQRIYYLGITVWRGMLWLPTDTALYAITPGLALQAVGPEQTETGYLAPSAPRGPITALAGDAHNLYAFRESRTGPGWVYKANAPSPPAGWRRSPGTPGSARPSRCAAGPCAPCGPATPAPGWCSTACWRPAPARPRWRTPATPWAGASCPRKGRDPRLDADYPYAPGGTLFYSRLIARFPGIDKSFYGITPAVRPARPQGGRADPHHRPVPAGAVQAGRAAGRRPPPPTATTWGGCRRPAPGTREPFVLFGRGLDTGIRLASPTRPRRPRCTRSPSTTT